MRRDVLVVAHSYFPSDPRIRKEVDSLLEAGKTVDVVCLRGPGQAARERTGPLRVRRLPVARHRGAGLLTYLLEYATFLVMAKVYVGLAWLRGRHRVVQVHTLPDPLVFAAAVPRLLGARVVLDMHELAPEFFQSRYRLRKGHPALRLLELAERASCAFAHHVITVSEPVAEVLASRSMPRHRITVVMNTAPTSAPGGGGGTRRPDGPFTLIYAGLLSDLYDMETALRALAALRQAGHRDIRLRLVGDGPALPRLREMAAALELGDAVAFEGRVAPERVKPMLEAADAGLVPLAPLPYMEYALPTKLFESLAAGHPVITTRMRTIGHYFGEDALCYVDPADPQDLAARILELRDAPAERARLAARGLAAAAPLGWETQAERYVRLLDALARGLDPAVDGSSEGPDRLQRLEAAERPATHVATPRPRG
jgi:glycosyltransferase involved in cell wall biosynthesis